MAENNNSSGMGKRRALFYTIAFFFILSLVAIWYASCVMGRNTKKGVLNLHGWVEGTEITLSSKVTGNIIKLPIDEGHEVKLNELILQIDSEQIKAELEAVGADTVNAGDVLKNAVNNISILESKVKGAVIELELTKKQSDASIKKAGAGQASTEELLKQCEFNYDKAQKDYVRFSALIKKKKISETKMDSIEEAYRVNKARVAQAKKDLEKSKANLAMARTTLAEIKLKANNLETLKRELDKAKIAVDIAQSALAAKKAKQKKVEADLADTFIYTPVKGTIIEKFVELGEHVVPGTPTVLIINRDEMYIKTYVEQIYIGKIKYNDPARIYIDSFPDRYFEGRVTLIAPKAEFTPRDVQMDEHRSRIVYKVEVGINNPEGLVKPGMPADVLLKWDKDRPW
ncbi:MAG: HlyD family secretion protein [Desulfosarcina sp.]|nr:HlyD family secretion protein [Desulfobacterales bacterium]